MRCSQCGVDSNYKDRLAAGGACPACQQRFAFEPKSGDSFTDMAFKAAIDRVSGGGRVRFHPAHLRFELNRILYQKQRSAKRVLLAILGLVALGGLCTGILALVNRGELVILNIAALFSILPILVLRSLRRPHLLLQEDRFQPLWQRWIAAHGPPEGLIPPSRQLPAPELPPDILSYSFDRVVVCDRAETAELLIANNFHFENNCAVLGVDGYPAHAFETLRTMVRQNPKIQVFALHDATVKGWQLARRLAEDPEWFAGIGQVIDVGLNLGHVEAFRGLWEPGPGRLRVTGFSHKEMEFLMRHRLRLEAIRPEQVIKRLFRAISAWPENVETKSDDVSTASIIFFSTDAGTSDGGGDSFG